MAKFLTCLRWVLLRRAKLGEKPYQIVKQRAGGRGRVWKFYFTLRFRRNAAGPERAQNESEARPSRPDLSPSRAGRNAVFDSEADTKQLPPRFQIPSVSGLRFSHPSALTLHPEQAATIVHLSAQGGTLT